MKKLNFHTVSAYLPNILVGMLVVGVLAFIGIFFSAGSASVATWTDLGLRLTYLYCIAATMLIIGFAVHHLIQTWRDSKGMIFGVLSLVLVWIVSRIISSGKLEGASPKLLEQLQENYGAGTSSMVASVEASLYTLYVLILVAVGSLLYAGVSKFIKK